MSDSTYCVYKHTSPDGKVYIGITHLAVRTRWNNGAGYKPNARFTAAINEIGWDNFKHEVLYDGLTRDQATMLEHKLIVKHDATNPMHGYNLTAAYNPGRRVGWLLKELADTQEVRQCIGRALRAARGTLPLELVAYTCDVTVTSLHRYEQGLFIPRDEVKERLTRFYGYKVQCLFYE